MLLYLDTYALIEIHDGNNNYIDLLNNEIVLTEITLSEFYGVLYRRLGEKTAEHWVAKFSPFAVQTTRDILLKASKYKEDHRKENISFFDSVGYVYAQEHGMRFVTGDNAFKGKQGVLFVK